MILKAKKKQEEETRPQSGNRRLETGIQRVKSGVRGLDKLIQGGYERDNSIVIKGATGVGKTVFALQFLYEGIMEHDEPGMYMSFVESKDAIFKRGLIFGWDFEKMEKEGKFIFTRYEPHEVKGIISSGGGSIRDVIESNGRKRLVIDSLSAYLLLFENEYEANRSVLELFEMLHGMKCTTLVTSESPITPSSAPCGKAGFLTDGIIHLYSIRKGPKRIRALEVVKMRNTSHTTSLCTFEITKKGIVVHEGGSVS
jgi:circadian clock protein KaiC